jgi:hypothetical protein
MRINGNKNIEQLEVAEPSPLLQLPFDILKRICSHFTTEDWVRSYGSVNKALYQLQPAQLTIATSRWNMSRLVPGNVEAVVR